MKIPVIVGTYFYKKKTTCLLWISGKTISQNIGLKANDWLYAWETHGQILANIRILHAKTQQRKYNQVAKVKRQGYKYHIRLEQTYSGRYCNNRRKKST